MIIFHNQCYQRNREQQCTSSDCTTSSWVSPQALAECQSLGRETTGERQLPPLIFLMDIILVFDDDHLGIWWWSSWYLMMIFLVFGDHHPREDCQIIFYHLWRQASKEILWRRTMQVPSELAEWQMMFENIKTISSGDSPPYSPVMRGWSTWFSSGKGSQEGKTQTFRGQGISMKRLLRR